MQKISLPIFILIGLTFLASCTTEKIESTPIVAPTVPRTAPSIPTDTVALPTDLPPTTSSTPKDTTPVSSAKTQSRDSTKTTTQSISYNAPHGYVTTKYSITVKDGVVESASATMTSGDHESQMYHSRFSSALQSQVVGKKISELSLDALGGASLTTEAFRQVINSL